ncbi:ABC transporter permease [Peptoniphilus asaccharolyticus]
MENNIYNVKNKKFHCKPSEREKALIIICVAILFITYIFVRGYMITETDLKVNFAEKFLGPSAEHIFGTDAVGRDMYLRTVKGLCTSILVGVVASVASVFISLIFTVLLTVFGGKMDTFVNWLIDVSLSIPHMVFLIVVSVAFGRGFKGIIVGIALTHWTSLTRVIRAEILEIKQENYIKISKAMGKSNFYIAFNHVIPKVMPQILVGTILLFPHAILHEAGITFLGFGFNPSTPAIGIILSESMKYLIYGNWHLAIFPGIALVAIVVCINFFGESLKNLICPYAYHR